MPEHWVENEHGVWCPACGDLLAAPWQMDDEFVAPETCRQCGFPDFEDGPGYFIGEDDTDEQ